MHIASPLAIAEFCLRNSVMLQVKVSEEVWEYADANWFKSNRDQTFRLVSLSGFMAMVDRMMS